MKYLWLIIPIITMFLSSYIWDASKDYWNMYPWIEMPTFFSCLLLFIASAFFAIKKLD